MRKALLLLALFTLCLAFLGHQKNIKTSVFSIQQEPAILMQGQHKATIIFEITFLPEDFNLLFPLLQQQNALILTTTEVLKRSPDFLMQLQKHSIAVGMYSERTYENDEQLVKHLNEFTQLLGEKPLYFTHASYTMSDSLLQVLFSQQINMIAPTVIYPSINSLTDGSFVFIPVHEHVTFKEQDIRSLIQRFEFVSIEENIFDYTLKSKRWP